MSKFMEAVRRLFSRKTEDKSSKGKEETAPSQQNDVQKAVRAPRPYDKVAFEEGGAGPQIGNDTEASNVQVAPKRAPRMYEEVDVPGPGGGGAVQVK